MSSWGRSGSTSCSLCARNKSKALAFWLDVPSACTIHELQLLALLAPGSRDVLQELEEGLAWLSSFSKTNFPISTGSVIVQRSVFWEEAFLGQYLSTESARPHFKPWAFRNRIKCSIEIAQLGKAMTLQNALVIEVAIEKSTFVQTFDRAPGVRRTGSVSRTRSS